MQESKDESDYGSYGVDYSGGGGDGGEVEDEYSGSFGFAFCQNTLAAK